MTGKPSLEHARSFLFLPADRLERLPKALASGAHAVILDLEDAVAAEAKPEARAWLGHAWSELAENERCRLLVRVNAAGSDEHEADLTQLQRMPGLGAVMLPKAETADAIGHATQSACAPVIPLVESALGLHALEALSNAPRVLRLAFGHLDFQADIGMTCSEDESELDSVRLQIVLASRRAGLPAPIDGVTPALDDATRLVADAARSRRMGFGGKLCIHPNQVRGVNDMLGPTQAQRAWAGRVLAASREQGQGAFRLDGEMIDAPVLRRAQALLGD